MNNTTNIVATKKIIIIMFNIGQINDINMESNKNNADFNQESLKSIQSSRRNL